MVTSAGSTPVSTGGNTAEMVLALLDDFALGGYVGEVKEFGRAGLSADTRVAAAALFRRVRETRTTGPGAEVDRTLRFAEAVLKPQWAMQQPGGKRYETYTNAAVLDWVLALDQRGSVTDRVRRCGETVNRKVRSWRAYEIATLSGTA